MRRADPESERRHDVAMDETVPAGDLHAFNAAIVGLIEVVAEFR